jgi:hypothetical protein
MKFTNRLAFSAALILCSLSAQAQDEHHLVIINHFDTPLAFTISVNANVIPGLPQQFNLSSSDQIETQVIDTQKEAYIRAETSNGNSAFFGVAIINNQLKISGYIGKGIAYSWNNESITFCTPVEYRKKGKC